MRLAEKTLELNFCSQFSGVFPGEVIWFGLTQRQEARAGFDAATRLGGRLLIFQFKASSRIFGHARRFIAPHQQMVRLQAICMAGRAIYYVCPLIGTTQEFSEAEGDALSASWLLDVHDL